VAQYAAAARLEPPTYGLLYNWGLASNELGQPDLALEKLWEAAGLEPSAQVYSQIGMVYARQSRWTEALDALARAETFDPGSDMIYDNRGGIRAHNHDLPGALADYRRALALNPANQHARQMLEIVERQLRGER
jgi:tetratricopeptide (TPR) repeat protein